MVGVDVPHGCLPEPSVIKQGGQYLLGNRISLCGPCQVRDGLASQRPDPLGRIASCEDARGVRKMLRRHRSPEEQGQLPTSTSVPPDDILKSSSEAPQV
eukprot:CAMPEP_0180560844 /NCGR_PEP_ID=MMETSP1037_2-20121125/3057_1 /TAXON_ID=632150 /ORGANISM="Azadinium spinosum, Strain 3D9" /LENGTH=98 /DNA_ID=CAMNT_0022577431 /DNA_START=12 /DNA_END=308 /DNA_ORIENTATION=-